MNKENFIFINYPCTLWLNESPLIPTHLPPKLGDPELDASGLLSDKVEDFTPCKSPFSHSKIA